MNSARDEDLDEDCDDFDVIIVGGGLTGLSAAYHLSKKRANLSLMILETKYRENPVLISRFPILQIFISDSVGGRLKSGEPFDLLLHSFQNNLTQLLQELEIELEPGQCSDGRTVFCDEDGPIDSMTPLIAAQVYYCMKSLNESSSDRRLNSSEDNEEFAILAQLSGSDLIDRMVLSSRAKFICQSLISLSCGLTNLNEVSALWLLEVLHGAGGCFQRVKFFLNNNSRYFIKGGNSVLLQRLTDKIIEENVIMNCSETVSKITFNDFRNFVTTNYKTYKCRYVILAISPADSGIIIPQVPEIYTKCQNSYISNRLIYFECNSIFQNSLGTIVPLILQPWGHLRLIQETCTPPGSEIKILSGYFSVENSSDEHRRSLELFRTLRQCSSRLENMEYDERERKGLMCVLSPSPIRYHLNLMRNPHRRIFFAASEYSREWPGTADGAVEAGEHSACLVLSDVRPQTLTRDQITKYIPVKTRKLESKFEVWMAGSILLIANSMIFWSFCRSAYNF
ncbi:LOW QUALITY PROTEIN: amine oxidase [flavin-containing] A [Fopius arisanus]|uniref:Amine oxidase n=1 Tax=Fopius arisanus TaxID=64838 RepID=A0A9R1TFA1_9HYME|nr:PREDICTED: LOW QUALITY PROTEIN: amine oxidase [flavin-containing] A-like [Fopius arisanus]